MNPASLFAGLALSDTREDLFRNIVSLRVSQDLFDDLSDNPSDWQTAVALELACKPATFTAHNPIIHRPFEEAAWNEAIGYPFRHWMRSRFSDGAFGVWYGADTIETTVYETVHHWHRGLLGDAGFTAPGVSIERKVYRVRCDAALVDLRAMSEKYPALLDPNDYTITHQVGSRLHREGHPGLATRSARCAGDVFAVLNHAVLSDPRQNGYLKYMTTQDGVVVERTPGRIWLTLDSI